MPLTAALRTTPLAPVLGASVLAATTLTLMVRPWAGGAVDLAAVRLAVVLIALGAVFALDDPAAATLSASPTSLPRRRAAAVAVAGAAAAIAVVAVSVGVAAAGSGLRVDGAGRVAIEAAAIGALGLSASAWRIRRRGGGSGAPAGIGLVAIFFLGSKFLGQVDPRFDLLAPGGGTPVNRALWLAVLAWSTFALVWLSRDPASRPK